MTREAVASSVVLLTWLLGIGGANGSPFCLERARGMFAAKGRQSARSTALVNVAFSRAATLFPIRSTLCACPVSVHLSGLVHRSSYVLLFFFCLAKRVVLPERADIWLFLVSHRNERERCASHWTWECMHVVGVVALPRCTWVSSGKYNTHHFTHEESLLTCA
jgi:hypothetical protein